MTKARDLADLGPNTGLVHIDTLTGSSVSAINANNVFSATYDSYLVICTLTNPSADAYFSLRLRNSGSDITTGYYGTWLEYAVPTTGNARSVNNDTRIWANALDSSTASGYHWSAWVHNPFNTQRTTFTISNYGVNSVGIGITSTGGAYEAAASSRDGITFYVESGNANFKLSIYGAKVS